MGRLRSGKTIINITYNYNISIHNDRRRFTWIQKAQSGGQINKDVGFNANQGGQNAVNRSKNIQKGPRPDNGTTSGLSSVWLSKLVK
ncbi:hypothetical protein SAMN05518855_1003307 [Paenibacillus sp. CF384]|nr:hypothetical protein SAMN05518855_1003307 [Paenibacillus sp. CF384]